MIIPPQSFTLAYSGKLPIAFPMIQVAPWWGHLLIGASGTNPVMPGDGVGVLTPLIISDPEGLLTSLEFVNLGAMLNANLTVGGCAVLTSLKFDELECCGTLLAIGLSPLPLLTTFSAPKLLHINGALTVNSTALTVLMLDAATYIGSIHSSGNPLLTTVSLAALKFCGGITVSSAAALTTFSAPALVNLFSGILMNSGLGALANVTIGTPGVTKDISGSTINISGQALTAASVNGILATLVSLDGTGGTTLWGAGKVVNLSGGTSAAPSGQGIIDKATLIARTATVTTN